MACQLCRLTEPWATLWQDFNTNRMSSTPATPLNAHELLFGQSTATVLLPDSLSARSIQRARRVQKLPGRLCRYGCLMWLVGFSRGVVSPLEALATCPQQYKAPTHRLGPQTIAQTGRSHHASTPVHLVATLRTLLRRLVASKFTVATPASSIGGL